MTRDLQCLYSGHRIICALKMPEFKYLDYIKCTAYHVSMQLNSILTDFCIYFF